MAKVLVDQQALSDVLDALLGYPHQIRELQMTRRNDELLGPNPINILLKDWNAHCQEHADAKSNG